MVPSCKRHRVPPTLARAEAGRPYFEVLGVRARLGRAYTAADDRLGCGDPGVVVSHGFWQRELGGDLAAVGRKLTVERHSLTVVGVTPPGFFGLEIRRSFDKERRMPRRW